MPKTSPNRAKKSSEQSAALPIALLISIITGFFAVVTTVVTAGPSWLAALHGVQGAAPIVTSVPTWPPLPLYHEVVPTSVANPPIRLSNLEITPASSYFASNIDAAAASAVPLNQRFPATSEDVFVSIDAVSLSTNEWIKLRNQILFRVDSVQAQLPDARQNILMSGPGGGLGFEIFFIMFVSGPLQQNDSLISPASTKADFFTLQPGELMTFKVDSRWSIPPGSYKLTPGLIYTYAGETHTVWVSNSISLLSPSKPIFWIFKNGVWVSSSSH